MYTVETNLKLLASLLLLLFKAIIEVGIFNVIRHYFILCSKQKKSRPQ